MDSIEIADAYVAIHAKMPGVERDVAKGLGAADSVFEDAGKRGGALFGKMAGASLIGNLGADLIGNAVSGIVGYMSESVDAYKEAEAAQVQLSDAYSRFPAITDVSLDSLRDLNSELMNKTRFDDDALASGQALLAQYGLTGSQLQQLTPLVADFAAKTGTDVVTASGQVGKALLGQGKALKGVGIDFQDAGSVAANFDQIMGGLTTQVGGFAGEDAASAAGMAERLSNQFGEIQETIGAAVMPMLQEFSGFLLSTVIPAIQTSVEWVIQNKDTLIALGAGIAGAVAAYYAINTAMALHKAYTIASAAATGGLTVAQWAFNAAATANPIGLIVIAIAALIAGIVLLVMNWDQVVSFITTIWGGFISWMTGVIDGFVGWWNSVWSGFASWIGDVWNGFVGVIRAVWEGYITWLVGIVTGVVGWWNGAWQAVANTVTSAWNGIVSIATSLWQGYTSWLMGIVSGLIGWWNGIWGTVGNVIRDVFGGIGSFIGGIFNNVVGVIRSAINSIIGVFNGAIGGINSMIGVVGGAIGVDWTIPSIPRLAEGAIVSARPGGIMANIGEGRYDEAVLPLSPKVLGALGGGGGGKTLKQYIYPQQTDPRLQARQWGREAERAFASA